MKYFSHDEFKRSDTAALRGIDNTIPADARQNIERLVNDILDPLRQAWGKPLIVTSGYRCPALNKAVGGSATSHHMRGMAADITAGDSVSNRRLYQLAQQLKLPYTQLIGAKYRFGWLHIGYNPTDTRHETF